MKTFGEKLKQAMQKLHLNQIQVSGLTGKSKGSISQYLSEIGRASCRERV